MDAKTESVICNAVEASGYSADMLPYSPKFEQVYLPFENLFTRNEFSREIVRIRKNGKLKTARRQRGYGDLSAFKSKIESIASSKPFGPLDQAAYTPAYETFLSEVVKSIPEAKTAGVWALWCNLMKWRKHGSWNQIPTSSTPNSVLTIPVDHLKVDEAYQRWIAGEHKTLLKEVFNPQLCGTLTVGKRPDDSYYYVIDGQRRLFRAINCGVSALPCFVIASSGRQYEADLFLGINEQRKKVSRPSNLQAAATAGSQQALAILASLEHHGFSLALQQERSWPHIRSVSTLHRAYRENVLNDMLTVIGSFRDASAEKRTKAVGAYFVDAVMTLLVLAKQAKKEYGTSYPDLARLSSVCDPLVVHLKQLAKVGPGGGRAIPMASVIEERYNTRLRNTKPIGMVVKGQLWIPRPENSKLRKSDFAIPVVDGDNDDE